MNLFLLGAESKYALTTVKKGFIISLGCKAKKPTFIHLFAPLIFGLTNGQTQSINIQNNKLIKQIFKMLFLDSIDRKIIINKPIQAKHKCRIVK